jgi:hypothetical protein
VAGVNRATVWAAATDLDSLAQGTPEDGDQCSLRWILLHLVQEHGQHLGHIDLIRETIDGTPDA